MKKSVLIIASAFGALMVAVVVAAVFDMVQRNKSAQTNPPQQAAAAPAVRPELPAPVGDVEVPQPAPAAGAGALPDQLGGLQQMLGGAGGGDLNTLLQQMLQGGAGGQLGGGVDLNALLQQAMAGGGLGGAGGGDLNQLLQQMMGGGGLGQLGGGNLGAMLQQMMGGGGLGGMGDGGNLRGQLGQLGGVRRQRPAPPAQETVLNLTASFGARLADAANGLRVIDVRPGTTAAKAGLKVGDIITQIDGKRVTKGGEAKELLGQAGHGKPLQILVNRRGEEITLTATP